MVVTMFCGLRALTDRNNSAVVLVLVGLAALINTVLITCLTLECIYVNVNFCSCYAVRGYLVSSLDLLFCSWSFGSLSPNNATDDDCAMLRVVAVSQVSM